MGWRFRKTIKVAPGIRLNLSRSGVSTTVGSRGASINIGKNGVYRNLSIPGTGVYRRDNLVAAKHSTGKSMQSTRTTSHSTHDQVQHGNPSGPSSYQPGVGGAGGKGGRNAVDPVERMVQMWRTVPVPSSADDLQRELRALAPRRYRRKAFDEPLPNLDDLAEKVSREADGQVKTLVFWKSYRMKDAYVKEHIAERYDEEYEVWESRKRAFGAQEAERERTENESFDRECAQEKSELKRRLDGNADDLSAEISRRLSGLRVPLAKRRLCRSVFADGEARIDVKLPPAESLPAEESVTLKSGKTKKKAKTQKRLREEYASYLFNLAAYIAAIVMDAGPVVAEIVFAVYSPRKNSDGEDVVDCVFAARMTRDEVCAAVRARMDAEEFCLSVENRCNMTKTKILKVVKPL